MNPFIAVYYAAQRTSDLINGAQQDIHEFWMTLKDLLNADATSKVDPVPTIALLHHARQPML